MSSFIYGLFWNNGYENYDFTYSNKTYEKQITMNTSNIHTLTEENKKDIYEIEINNIQINEINEIFAQLPFSSLIINKCKIKSINNLKINNNCKKISIIDSNIEEYDILDKIKIEYIKIYSSNIDINTISNNTNLMELYYRYNKLNELPNLSALQKLQILTISNNNIKNINQVKELINLKILNISNNEIESLEPLYRLRNLEYIYADNNKIKNIICINNLKKIKYLNLSSNPLENIDDIIYFTELETLKIKNTTIRLLPNLLELKNIDYNSLEIDWNNIDKINGMKGFSLIKHIIKNI
jgi:Leucine-rich repeat (LRR) protein